jgi:hypothetical protein
LSCTVLTHISFSKLVPELDEVAIRINSRGEMERVEKDIIARAYKVPAIVKSEDAEEDIMERNTFHQFAQRNHNLSLQLVDRVLLLFEFEDMVNDYLETKLDDFEEERFTDRIIVEELRKETFLQVYNKAMATKPEVLTKYYPHTDSMLIALHTL